MKATLKNAFWLVLAMFVSSMFGGSWAWSIGLWLCKEIIEGIIRFLFGCIVFLLSAVKHYERNNRIFLLSLLRRSDGDLFPPCEHHSFCRWRREPAARSRTLENPSAARRLFRVRFRRTSSMGTPAQAQRSNPIFQMQADESRVLTPKRLRQ